MAAKRVALRTLSAGDKFLYYGHIQVVLDNGHKAHNYGLVCAFNFNRREVHEWVRSSRVIPYKGEVPAEICGKVVGSTN